MRYRLGLIKKFWPLYLFIGVFGVLSVIFGLYPLLKSMVLSLVDSHTVFTSPKFVGIDNYIRIFRDPYFWNSFRVTVIFTVCSVTLNLVTALLLAQLLSL